MEKARKILVPIIAVLCVLAIVYFLFFFGKNAVPKDEFTTNALKEYTISFENPQLDYQAGLDFMQGVLATGENGEDLTSFVTVSCKPTNDISKKTLTYSINKSGYKISTYERDLVLPPSYKGPSIKAEGTSVEVPLDQVKNLSSIISSSGVVESDDGFGAPCSLTATLPNKDSLALGDYIATVTAQNIFGDTANAKVMVTITKPESSVIKLSASSITIKKGEKFEPMNYVISAYDDKYGDILDLITVNRIDTSKIGIYTIEYRIRGIQELENEVAYLYVTVN